ncbi:MAG: alpha/beta fold hydrolase [Oscillospiraceae bacterium]
MPKAEKKDIWFDSADGKSKIAGYFYTGKTKPFCIVQLSHGMCEYVGRYEELADYLTEHGVVFCGNDHLGHGASAANPEDLGYFGGKGSRKYCLQDLHTMNELAKKEYPGLPVILLGHSMGSFFARIYAARWPQSIDGLIISGTGGPNPAAGMGMALASLLGSIKGQRYRSAFVNNLAFGTYLKQIESPKTPYDWISRDDAIVAQYAKDPLCTFVFTVMGFYELFGALKEVSSPAWAAKLDKDKPLFMLAGDKDPVGAYGKGVQTVCGWIHEAGVHNFEQKMYPGGRHEMYNETNRTDVYADTLSFLQKYWN